MKILFTHRYYWPDSPPYGSMLRNLATEVAESHDVHVYTSRPSYRDVPEDHIPCRETEDDVHIHRGFVFGSERAGLFVRVLNSSTYCVGLFAEIMRIKPDVVTAATFPPVAAAWIASLAAQIVRAKFIYHMQDIHPEVSIISGGLMGKPIIRRIMRWMDNQTLRRADAVVVLSDDMASTLADRNVSIRIVRVINNPPLQRGLGEDKPPTEYRKSAHKKRLIFAGNLGRFQNLELLTDGISRCFSDHPDLELVYLGDGDAEPALRQEWGENPQVKFFPFLPYEQAQELIKEADVGLVSLESGVCSVSFPSKVSTYLNLGVPIFVLTEATSELAIITKRNGLGAVPLSMAPESIADALRELLKKSGRLSKSSCDWFVLNWSESANHKSWIDLINYICESENR